jgi:hypothetical protein
MAQRLTELVGVASALAGPSQVPQRNVWIDARRAAGGQIARDQGGNREWNGHEGKDRGIDHLAPAGQWMPA